MEKLFEYQQELLKHVSNSYFRSLFDRLDWEQRMFGIIGLRGAGKTTMLLQYLKYKITDKQNTLYVSADHTWFLDRRLLDLAEEFDKYGGRLLLIDEVHKYPEWSRELKNIYDSFPDLQVIFSASSTLDILKGKADLSRRALTFELPGMSFREYLEFVHNKKIPVFTLEQTLKDTRNLASSINRIIKPLPLFRQYLKNGYFPFSISEKEQAFYLKLNQIIITVLETDFQVIEEFSTANFVKMKKLLGVIAESAPFEPNISKIAQKLQMGRDTVKTYLQYLQKARLLNLLSRESKGIAALQKPDKIYLENTNLSYALKENPDRGTLRETFFINQLRNAGYKVDLGKQGDFFVEEKWVFEVGGPSKGNRQIKTSDKAFLALDETEHAFLNRIPLWLFGFLY